MYNLLSFRYRRRRIRNMGWRQPLAEQKDKWIMIGTVAFNALDLTVSALTMALFVISGLYAHSSWNDIPLYIGIWLLQSKMILGFILFFVGNLQFRKKAVENLRIVFCHCSGSQICGDSHLPEVSTVNGILTSQIVTAINNSGVQSSSKDTGISNVSGTYWALS